jgi:hypothetical protein
MRGAGQAGRLLHGHSERSRADQRRRAGDIRGKEPVLLKSGYLRAQPRTDILQGGTRGKRREKIKGLIFFHV